MKFKLQLLALLLPTFLLICCDNNSKENSGKLLNQGKTLNNYYFAPAVSTLNGTLKVELYYGPPNYGESPETDAKEYAYIFYPDQTINVIQTLKVASFDETTKGITKFQLAPMDELSLHPFIGKRITVTGLFFGKHTGHHHTDVLMRVLKAEKR